MQFPAYCQQRSGQGVHPRIFTRQQIADWLDERVEKILVLYKLFYFYSTFWTHMDSPTSLLRLLIQDSPGLV